MIWGILIGLAYLAVGALAFREVIRLQVTRLPDIPIEGVDVAMSAWVAVMWPIFIPVVWGVWGGPSWIKPRDKSKRPAWQGIVEWATKKKED